MKEFNLVSSVSTDYDNLDRCYVLHLSYSQPAALLAAALSTRAVKLYSLRETRLQYTGQLEGHTGRITGTSFLPENDNSLLQTASTDGSIREWDVRSQTCTTVYRTSGEVYCTASHHHLMAAGVGDNVVFWDRRYGRQIAVFNETHYQDVTQVEFGVDGQGGKLFLISGSEDGSIASFDVGGPLNEEEGFCAALNVETAVARIGLFGNRTEKLWCCTGTESLFLWDWLSGCAEDGPGGKGPSGQILNPREIMCLPNASKPPTSTCWQPVDYLMQCEYDDVSQQLFLVSGTSSGDCGLYQLDMVNGLQVSTQPTALLAGGHSDIVRCMDRMHSFGFPSVQQGADCRGVWFTGGEDSKICVWNAIEQERMGADPNGAIATHRVVNKHHMGRRASPY
jgi:phosphoribosyl-AMP cyclohydrolase